MQDAAHALSIATETALATGTFLAERYADIHERGMALAVQTKGSPLDLVTEVDAASQKLIVKALHTAFPSHRFIAEEDGASDIGDPESPYTWIIDPLDATTCFVHGRKNFGVIIALQNDGVTELGVMVLPLLNMVFAGRRGHGVTCNGQTLALRKTQNLSDAILCSNTIRRARKGDDGILRITTPPCASLENYGSAAEEFAEVLLGHNDGVFFDGIRLWDVAAGCFMIEELGGRSKVVPLESGDLRGGFLVAASTAAIFPDLERAVFTDRITKQ